MCAVSAHGGCVCYSSKWATTGLWKNTFIPNLVCSHAIYLDEIIQSLTEYLASGQTLAGVYKEGLT